MARMDKINSYLQKEIAVVIKKEFTSSKFALFTITGVETTRDLKDSTVFFSVYGDDSEKARVKERLSKASGYISSIVAKRIRFRRMPVITFEYDTSIEYGSRIDSILRDLKK